MNSSQRLLFALAFAPMIGAVVDAVAYPTVSCPPGAHIDSAGIGCQMLKLIPLQKFDCPPGYAAMHFQGENKRQKHEKKSIERCERLLTMPPFSDCMKGYQLVSESTCRRTMYAETINLCPKGFKVDGTICERFIHSPADVTCPLGSLGKASDKGKPCQKRTSVSPVPTCSKGYHLLLEGICQREKSAEPSVGCRKGTRMNNSGTECIGDLQTSTAISKCPPGSHMVGTTCTHKKLQEATASCAKEYHLLVPMGQSDNAAVCVRQQSSKAELHCPKNFRKDERQCVHYIETESMLVCAEGTFRDGKKCISTISVPAIRVCVDDSYAWVEKACRKKIVRLPSFSCPLSENLQSPACLVKQFVPPEATCPSDSKLFDLNDQVKCKSKKKVTAIPQCEASLSASISTEVETAPRAQDQSWATTIQLSESKQHAKNDVVDPIPFYSISGQFSQSPSTPVLRSSQTETIFETLSLQNESRSISQLAFNREMSHPPQKLYPESQMVQSVSVNDHLLYESSGQIRSPFNSMKENYNVDAHLETPDYLQDFQLHASESSLDARLRRKRAEKTKASDRMIKFANRKDLSDNYVTGDRMLSANRKDLSDNNVTGDRMLSTKSAEGEVSKKHKVFDSQSKLTFDNSFDIDTSKVKMYDKNSVKHFNRVRALHQTRRFFDSTEVTGASLPLHAMTNAFTPQIAPLSMLRKLLIETQCQEVPRREPKPICESNYILENLNCVLKVMVPFNYTCENGTLRENECQLATEVSPVYVCPPGFLKQNNHCQKLIIIKSRRHFP